MKTAIVLLGHGSRDPLWSQPFERLAARVRERVPGTEVRVAYLELMTPDLRASVAALATAGRRSIRIVPVFVGQGAHIRSDLPRIVEELRRDYPAIAFQCVPAIGDAEEVLDAFAAYSVRDLD